jgi:hypothetical protein
MGSSRRYVKKHGLDSPQKLADAVYIRRRRMPWELKKTEDGGAVVNDSGLPVFLDDEGKDIVFDPNQMHGKILDLNSESKRRREESAALKERLKLVEDIEDLSDFRSRADAALNTMQNLKDKDLVKAGEVDKLKAEMRAGFEDKEQKLLKQFEEREGTLTGEVAKKDAAIRKLLISNKFASCDLFAGSDSKTTLDPEFAESYFGRFFDVQEENGEFRVVAKDKHGEPVLSRERIGELADFDEAINKLFNDYPGRDKFLRSTGGGSGGTGGSTGVPNVTPLAKLASRYKELMQTARGDKTKMQEAVSIKRQMHEMQQAQR